MREPQGALATLHHAVLETAQWVATLAELAAIVIVALAVLEAAWRVVGVYRRRDRVPDEIKESLRLQLGRWLAIALEFLLAADIVLTAVAPSWEAIGKLAAVAAIRTLLNYFLQQEIKEHERQHGRTTHPDHT